MIKIKEKQILDILRKNARIPLIEISKKVGIPLTTAHDNLKRVIDKNIIIKKVSIFDFNKMNFAFNVIFFVKARHKLELISNIFNDQHINTISKISNGFDFLIECNFSNSYEYEEFKSLLSNYILLNIRECLIIKKVECESFQLTKKIY